MSEISLPNRCRIVLIAPPPGAAVAERVESALAGGDVASLIVPDYGTEEDAFQEYAENLTRLAQESNVAVIIAGAPRVAARIHADGIHFEGPKQELADIVEKHRPKMMVGCGGAKTRHDALELGEAQPDYIFFGRFGYDTKPEPHPRNLALGEWWSQIIQVPCIVMAGASVESVNAVAQSGVEFVALGEAVFAEGAAPGKVVSKANDLLDQHAPSFDD